MKLLLITTIFTLTIMATTNTMASGILQTSMFLAIGVVMGPMLISKTLANL